MAGAGLFFGVANFGNLPRVTGTSRCFAVIGAGLLRLKWMSAIVRRFACLFCLETLSNGEGELRVRLEHWWYAVPLRVRSMFRRNQVEKELDEEFHFHLEQLIVQEMAAGKTAGEARRNALRAMDGIERQKENCRDMRRVPYIESLVYDLRHGVRALLREPRFAAGVTAILALGVGASTAVFSVVDAVLLRPLPYTAADRLVKVEENTSKREMNAVMLDDFFALARRTDLFDRAVAYVRDQVTVTGAGEPTEAIVSRVSAGLFSMLGARARLGRALVETDDDRSEERRVGKEC